MEMYQLTSLKKLVESTNKQRFLTEACEYTNQILSEIKECADYRKKIVEDLQKDLVSAPVKNYDDEFTAILDDMTKMSDDQFDNVRGDINHLTSVVPEDIRMETVIRVQEEIIRAVSKNKKFISMLESLKNTNVDAHLRTKIDKMIPELSKRNITIGMLEKQFHNLLKSNFDVKKIYDVATKRTEKSSNLLQKPSTPKNIQI